VGNFELFTDYYVWYDIYVCGPQCGINEFEEAGNIDGEV
jgi:hypothetical protein